MLLRRLLVEPGGIFSQTVTRSPILNIGLVGGGVRASANIFKAIFGTSITGYMLRGSKKWLGRPGRSAKPFFVEISRIHVEGVGKWLGRRGEVRQAIFSLQGTAALLLGFLMPRIVWCK